MVDILEILGGPAHGLLSGKSPAEAFLDPAGLNDSAEKQNTKKQIAELGGQVRDSNGYVKPEDYKADTNRSNQLGAGSD